MKARLLTLVVFPAALVLSLAGASAAAADDTLSEAFARATRCAFGDDRAPLAPIEQAVAAAGRDARLRADLEHRFLALLRDPAATEAAKDFACRQISLIASQRAVPALAALLPDPHLSGIARQALERIPDRRADEPLRKALRELRGPTRLGVIGSLGERRDPRAVRPLRALLRDPDPAVASAAAVALGKIGTASAARALLEHRQRTPQPALREALNDGCLRAAWHRARQHDLRTGVRIFDDFFTRETSDHLRLAGFEGLLFAQPAEAPRRILTALDGTDEILRRAAASAIAEITEAAALAQIANGLGRVRPEGQVAALRVLQSPKDTMFRSAVRALLERGAPAARTAALEALGVIGEAADVSLLARWAATGAPAESRAARAALVNLTGRGVEEALMARLSGSDVGVRLELLRALAARGTGPAADTVARLLRDPEPRVVEAALTALGSVGNENHVRLLADHFIASRSDAQRQASLGALESIAGRFKAKAAPPLLAALHPAAPSDRAALLPLLSTVGGPEALNALRDGLGDADAGVRDAAARTVADWPDAAAIPILAELARASTESAHRALAFRGYVRLVRESEAAPDVKLRQLSEALELARTDAERRAVVGALGEVATPEALARVARVLTQHAALADEAGAAAVRIIAKLKDKHRDAVAPVLREVLARAQAESVRADARKQMSRFKLDAQ